MIYGLEVIAKCLLLSVLAAGEYVGVVSELAVEQAQASLVTQAGHFIEALNPMMPCAASITDKVTTKPQGKMVACMLPLGEHSGLHGNDAFQSEHAAADGGLFKAVAARVGKTLRRLFSKAPVLYPLRWSGDFEPTFEGDVLQRLDVIKARMMAILACSDPCTVLRIELGLLLLQCDPKFIRADGVVNPEGRCRACGDDLDDVPRYCKHAYCKACRTAFSQVDTVLEQPAAFKYLQETLPQLEQVAAQLEYMFLRECPLCAEPPRQ